MICSDIWYKYHEWYFKIVKHNLRQFWNITSGIYVKYHVQIMLLFVYTTTHKRFVIFTCRHFKIRWNTTALSQSNCRNFSSSSIKWFNARHFEYSCKQCSLNDWKQTEQRLKLQERPLTINKRNIIRWNIYRDNNFLSRRQVLKSVSKNPESSSLQL